MIHTRLIFPIKVVLENTVKCFECEFERWTMKIQSWYKICIHKQLLLVYKDNITQFLKLLWK